MTATMFPADFDMCTCVVAAAARDTAGDAVGTAAGAADFSVDRATVAARIITADTGELLSDRSDVFSHQLGPDPKPVLFMGSRVLIILRGAGACPLIMIHIRSFE